MNPLQASPRSKQPREAHPGVASLDDVPDAPLGSSVPRAVPQHLRDAGYRAPGQDNTRGLYHQWFQDADDKDKHPHGIDAGAEGLKNAMSAFENSWYVAAALTMTIGFAEIMYVPEGRHPGSTTDAAAKWAYVCLALFGTVNSVLGVWWAGHMVPQVHWHPAAQFSKFWYASMNTSMGRAQQFAKIAIQQLVLSLLPLCYLNFGAAGLALAAGTVLYMVMQVRTWSYLMHRMRLAYAHGLQSEQRAGPSHPFLDDVKAFSSCCKAPHLEGTWGWLTCQLVTPFCFAFRWLWRRPNDAEGFLPITQPALGRKAGRGNVGQMSSI